jgi:8-oxo-dGTP diphosphatase
MATAHTNASFPDAKSHPRVGVGVLLVDDLGRVLLTLRDRPPEAGCWSIVGGKVDYLETLEQCAVRETREEVGLEIRLVRLLCVTDHHLPQEGQHWVSPAYLGEVLAGEARNCEPEKTREVRWFALGDLPPNLTITARNAIAAYTRQFPHVPNNSSLAEIGPLTTENPPML